MSRNFISKMDVKGNFKVVRKIYAAHSEIWFPTNKILQPLGPKSPFRQRWSLKFDWKFVLFSRQKITQKPFKLTHQSLRIKKFGSNYHEL